MAQKSRNRIAVVRVMRMGGVNKGKIVSCTHKNKRKNHLYRPTQIPNPTPHSQMLQQLFAPALHL